MVTGDVAEKGTDAYAEMDDGTNALAAAVTVMDIDRFTAAALVRLAGLSAKDAGCSTVARLLEGH